MTDAASEHPIDRYIAFRQAADPSYGVTAFCDEVGIARSTYYRIVRGADDVGTGVFEKIEHSLRPAITATELFAAWNGVRKSQAATAQPATG